VSRLPPLLSFLEKRAPLSPLPAGDGFFSLPSGRSQIELVQSSLPFSSYGRQEVVSWSRFLLLSMVDIDRLGFLFLLFLSFQTPWVRSKGRRLVGARGLPPFLQVPEIRLEKGPSLPLSFSLSFFFSFRGERGSRLVNETVPCHARQDGEPPPSLPPLVLFSWGSILSPPDSGRDRAVPLFLFRDNEEVALLSFQLRAVERVPGLIYTIFSKEYDQQGGVVVYPFSFSLPMRLAPATTRNVQRNFPFPLPPPALEGVWFSPPPFFRRRGRRGPEN